MEQYIEEVAEPKVHVTRLKTWRGWRPKCEKAVASTHPRQVSEAGGAAGTHPGARAQGVACALKHQPGLSLAKTSEAMKSSCGVRTSPGGLAQLYQRVAGKPEDDYEQVRYPDFRYSTQETTIFGGTAAHNPLINRA